MKSYVTFDHIYFIKIEKKQRSERYLHTFFWFGVWRNSGMFNSFDGSAELDKHWTGHADGYEGMKVTLLVTELFFVPVVMDQLPEVNLGSGSDQRRQKHGDVQTCQMWCYGYFFGTLWVTLWEILIKLLVQLRNYPSTTKSYFYTFATFSTNV